MKIHTSKIGNAALQRLCFGALCFGAVSCGGSSTPVENTEQAAASGDEAHANTHAQATFVSADTVALFGNYVAELPLAVTSFGSATVGQHVYLAGGYFGEPHRYSREGQSKKMHRFHMASTAGQQTFEELADLPFGVQGHALVAIGDNILFCGGNRIENEAGTPAVMNSSAQCFRYLPTENRYEEVAPMPHARSSFDAAFANGKVYAVGGWALSGSAETGAFERSVDVYDLASNTWTSNELPFARRALAVVAVEHRVIAIGGMNENQTISKSVDILDTRNGTWTTGPEFPGDSFGMSAVALGNTVYGSARDGSVYAWNPTGTSEWRLVGSLMQPRFFHRFAAWGSDSIAVFGGIGSMTTDGRARYVESFRVEGTGTAGQLRTAGYEISFPGAARNRSGLLVQEDSVLVVGGNNSAEQHDFAPTNFVREAYRLHLPSARWYSLPELPEGRQSMVSLDAFGIPTFVGGFGHDEDAPRTYANAFALGSDNQWHSRDVLPAGGRTQFGNAVVGEEFFVVAGLDYDQAREPAQQFQHFNTVYKCAIDHDETEGDAHLERCEQTNIELPGTRRAFASNVVGGKLYVLGGMRENFAPVPDCSVYDLAAGTWSTFACPSRVRISADLVSIEGALYLVGGSSHDETATLTAEQAAARGPGGGLTADSRVERFDPQTGTWSMVGSLNVDTHHMRFFPFKTGLIGVSTQHAEHRARVLFVDVHPPVVAPAPTAPARPARARRAR